MHSAVYFDFLAWPSDGLKALTDIEKLVSSICIIRNEIKPHQTSSFKLFAHDLRGGVQGAAAFVILYDLMQQIDEGLTDDNRIKESATSLDVFNTVNRIRKDRANAIEDFATYNALFLCLNYYGPNRSLIQHDVSRMPDKKLKKDRKTRELNKPSAIFAYPMSDISAVPFCTIQDTFFQQKKEHRARQGKPRHV